MPKDKKNKIEPSRKKGTFFGYNETSKAYMIYVLGQNQVEDSWDIIFDEEVAFKKPRESHIEIDNEEHVEIW